MLNTMCVQVGVCVCVCVFVVCAYILASLSFTQIIKQKEVSTTIIIYYVARSRLQFAHGICWFNLDGIVYCNIRLD